MYTGSHDSPIPPGRRGATAGSSGGGRGRQGGHEEKGAELRCEVRRCSAQEMVKHHGNSMGIHG